MPSLQVIPITLTPIPVPNNLVAQNLSQLVAMVAQYLGAEIQADISFFPTAASDPVANVGPLIYNSTQNVFKFWSTSTGNYQPIGFLFVSQNPTTNQGPVFNTTTNLFYVWNGSTYIPLGLIPTVAALPTTNVGAFIFNAFNNCLMQWNGSAYIAVGLFYTNSDPLVNVGQIYNIPSQVIKNWNGTKYVSITPFIVGDEKTTYNAGDELAGGWIVEDGRAIAGIGGLTTTQAANLTGIFGANIPTRAGSGSPTNYFKVFCGPAN